MTGVMFECSASPSARSVAASPTGHHHLLAAAAVRAGRRSRPLLAALAASLLLAGPALAAPLAPIDAPLIPVAPGAAASHTIAGGEPLPAAQTRSRQLTGKVSAAGVQARLKLREELLAGPDGRGGARVVNGQKLQIQAVPWQVSTFSYTATGGFDCGATIIDPSTLITAAHCVDGTSIGKDPWTEGGIGVWAGVNTIAASTAGPALQERKVVSARVHPSWVPGSVSAVGDLAVLKLETPLTIDNVTTRAAALPAPQASIDGEPVPVGPTLYGSGYGLQAKGAPADTQLYGITLGAVAPYECGEGPGPDALVLCAKAPTGSMCMGDSGGPIVTGAPAAPVLVGVVSNGGADCPAGGSNSFTNLTAPEHRLFIDGQNAPPAAPRQVGEISMAASRPGALLSGDRLSCLGGAWTGAPSVKWRLIRDDNVVVASAVGASLQYLLGSGDVGHRFTCQAFASNAGGTQVTTPLTPDLVVGAGVPYAVVSAPTKAGRGRTFTAWVYLYNLPPSTASARVKLTGARWRIKSMNVGRVPDSQTLKDAGAIRLRVVMPRSARKGTKPKFKADVGLYNAGRSRLVQMKTTTRLRAR